MKLTAHIHAFLLQIWEKVHPPPSKEDMNKYIEVNTVTNIQQYTGN
jgi:hypothetical protein